MQLTDPFQSQLPIAETIVAGVVIRPGDRIRLRPKRTADILDIALTGKIAIVEAIEQDFENRIHLSVTIEDDPGREFGIRQQPGHRFFFSLDDVEPLASDGRTEAKE